MFRIFLAIALCCALFAETKFSGSIISQDNEVIFTATVIDDDSVDDSMSVFVNGEKIEHHPVLGYISGLPHVRPLDTIEVVVKDVSGNTIYRESVILPAAPAFYAPTLEVDPFYPPVYQWDADSTNVLFSYANDKELLFEKHFVQRESRVEIPKNCLNAGSGYISLTAMNGDSDSLLAATITSQKFMLLEMPK